MNGHLQASCFSSFGYSSHVIACIFAASGGCPVISSLEGHYGSLPEAPDVALRMVQALWPRVGLTYDPSHFTMQGIDLQDTAPLPNYTHHVHVRNASLDNMQET